MSLTESEILRRHAFYQTSYIGPRPVRGVYTPSLTPRRKSDSSQSKGKQRNLALAKSNPRKAKSATSCIDLTRDVETLDYRRDSRIKRSRPWRETTKLRKKSEKFQIHYEGTLPTHFDTTNLKLKGRNFVSNSRYGNMYILRQPIRSNTSRQKTPPTNTYVWEQDYLLWQTGTRDKYLEELTDRSRRAVANSETHNSYRCEPINTTDVGSTSVKSRDQFVENLNSRYKKSGVSGGSFWSVTSKTGYHKSRTKSLPNIDEKILRPSPAVHAYYNSYCLEKSRKQSSAVLIQRIFRGWNIRNYFKNGKRKALLDHGQTLTKFVTAYREIVARVQRRYGNTDTSCSFDLRQLNVFMDEKLKREAAFKKLAADDKLRCDDIMDFFNLCDFWPTQAEVDRNFDAIFRGSRNTADVIFLLDCSSCSDIIGFQHILQFIKDVVQGLDIGPNRVRVGVLPYNDKPFSSFDITAYVDKRSVLQAISKIRILSGAARTDNALRAMIQMFTDARPGVQKIGILLTAGKSLYPNRTETVAQQAREAGVTMFVIGIGSDAAKNEISAIASSPRHVFTTVDPSSMLAIRTKLEAMFCLAACNLCQHILPRITRSGLLISEALDLLWTTYPPAAADIGVEKYLNLKSLGDPYMLEPASSNVCLRCVIQSKLDHHGYSVLSSNIKEQIETVASKEEALLIISEFIKKSQNNIQAV